jgi:hypothetical protein
MIIYYLRKTGSFTFNSSTSQMLKLTIVTRLCLTTRSIQKLKHVSKLLSLPSKYTECGISQLTAAHIVGGHILGN